MHTQIRFLTALLCSLCAALAAPAMQLAEVIWEMSIDTFHFLRILNPIKHGTNVIRVRLSETDGLVGLSLTVKCKIWYK